MFARLTISSDARFRALVRAFGLEFARAGGVDEADAAPLVEALDEAVRFVCAHAYAGDPSGRIEVMLEPVEAGVHVAVHDWGRPLTSMAAPAEGPPELARLGAVVGNLRLINLGAEGKRLSFVWQTAHAVDVAPAATDAPAVAAHDADAARIVVRDGSPEDAEPIAQLLYENYALSYVHPDFYRPRWLREELRAGRVVSAVAVHAGEVVGHHALVPAPDGPAAETGVAVVAPAYRGLGIFGRLSEHTLARARAIDLAAVYGRAVTVHPYSQRVELAHGYRETALCLGASPPGVTMRNIPTAAAPARRTALMVSFLPLRRERRRGSLPARYRDILLDAYARLELPAPAPAAPPARAPSPLAVARESEAGVATLTLGGWDRTIAGNAIAAFRALLAEHFDVIYADLDLAAIADPDSAVAALGAQGFSYAGLWLHGPGDHDHLRLQYLNSTNVELEAISTASPAGRELAQFVLADHERLATVGAL
jgi:anti-sigma regulatory factor (Ser/Thr protein kinase)/GNAT superfamily N-acetyltransferase